MESTQLSQLLYQCKIWPKTKPQKDEVALQILMLLGARFTCFFTTDPKDEVGIQFRKTDFSDSLLSSLNPEAVVKFIREYIKPKDSPSNTFIKRINFEKQSIPGLPVGFAKQLILCASSDIDAKVPTKKLIVALATDVPLQGNEEASLVALTNKLWDLSRIDEMDSVLQIRNQFLSIASHELKTPLTSIYGILQLQERMLRMKTTAGQESFPEQDKHHEFLKKVIKQVERLNELIDGLLDVSRIQNGRFMVEPTETDVVALLRDCTQTRLAGIAKEAGVKLQFETDSEITAKVDPVRMEEVANNLIMNAIRFSPEGGVVWIRLKKDEDAFRLMVRDQGPSIPIEDRERIFQPFERAQRTSRMGGLGLGLFISRQIGLLHGGNVTLVESIPGKGNVFEAYFPNKSSNEKL